MKKSALCFVSVSAASAAALLVACGGDTIGDTIILGLDGGSSADATTSSDGATPLGDATLPDSAAPDAESGDDDASPGADSGEDAGTDSGADGGADAGADSGPDAGPTCSTATCASPDVCIANACVAPTCSDGVQDGTETGTDCGGSCAPALTCANGGGCLVSADCTSDNCATQTNGTRQCAAATCSDGTVNEGETGTDIPTGGATNTECGGPNCPACPDLAGCKVGSDCTDKICTIPTGATSGTCAAASCTDGLQNGQETGNDCGGTCGSCGGAACVVAVPTTCESGICTATGGVNGTCTTSSCTDGVKNDGETGIDCGGPSDGTVCGACTGGACTMNSDCAHDELCTNMVCTVPTSCAAILAAYPTATNGAYTIKPGTAAAYSAYCDFTTAGGPWTLVAKIGVHNSQVQVAPATWNYNDTLWTDTTLLNQTDVTLTAGDAKYQSYLDAPVTALRGDLDGHTVTFAIAGTSAQAVFANTVVATPAGDQTMDNWPQTAPFTSLYADPNFEAQAYCHYFGVNLAFTYANVRLGFLANNANGDGTKPCAGADTAIGLGITYNAVTAGAGYDTNGAGFLCNAGSNCYQGDSTTTPAPGNDLAVSGLLWVKSN